MTNVAARLKDSLADRYTIEGEIGHGGMADVFLAEDRKHDRKVAIKVFRPELSALLGGDRFLNEIKVTANLQHPHILPLYDSGSAEGLLYYVMPYVEGETLRDRLNEEKQLPVAEAVATTRAVASALDYAHRHGVVHRDIKPENILLHEGQPLVADFGIALAVSEAGGDRLTQTGLSLGTPSYMSPEQATGDRKIDGRSDIYSLGAVAYEMLVGDPPHTGSTAQAIVSKIVTEDPSSITEARPSVPPNLEAVIHTALAKLPADRFATAEAFATALERPDSVALSMARRAAPVGARTLSWTRAAVAAVAALALGVLLGRGVGGPEPLQAPAARFEIATPGLRLNPLRIIGLSPDGQSLVYSGSGDGGGAVSTLYVRRIDQLEGRPILGVGRGVNPSVSLDGSELLFTRFGQAFRIPMAGGQATPVPGVLEGPHTQWSEGGDVLFQGLDGGIWRARAGGGPTEQLTRPDTASGERLQQFTDVLRDGRVALVVQNTGAGVSGPLYAVDLETGERTPLLETPVRGAWYAGHETLVYTGLDGLLYGVPFDPDRLVITGAAAPLGGPVSTVVAGLSRVSASRNGSVLYVPQTGAQLAWVTPDGSRRPLLEQLAEYHNPRFSPDGRRIALDINDPAGRDVWVFSVDQETLTRVTFDNDGHDAIWSQDGQSLLYVSQRDGLPAIVRIRLDGAPGEVVVRGAVTAPAGWTADGVLMVIASPSVTAGGWNIATVERDTLAPFLATDFSEAWPALSPDGEWLAYVTDESRLPQVYLRRVDGVGGRVQISNNSGSEPMWAASGSVLYYLRSATSEMIAVELDLTGEPSVRSREPVLDWTGFERSQPHANYDVSPDGEGFITVWRGETARLVLIQNVQELVHGGQR